MNLGFLLEWIKPKILYEVINKDNIIFIIIINDNKRVHTLKKRISSGWEETRDEVLKANL